MKVTGGGNGLGRSISLGLAEKGCNVIILDVDVSAAEKTATEIRKLHNVKAFVFMVCRQIYSSTNCLANLLLFQVDVSKFNEVQNVRKQIEREIGEVDILVNNAGIIPEISLLEGAPEDIERIIQVNFISSLWVSCIGFILYYGNVTENVFHRQFGNSSIQ